MTNRPGNGRTIRKTVINKKIAGSTLNGKPGCKNYRIKRLSARRATRWLPLSGINALELPRCFYVMYVGMGVNQPDIVSLFTHTISAPFNAAAPFKPT
jgi:hypothetical protein